MTADRPPCGPLVHDPVPLRSFSITRTEGGVCARPGCDEPPVTLVQVDTGQECRACEQHWPGIVEAAYALTGIAHRNSPRQEGTPA